MPLTREKPNIDAIVSEISSNFSDDSTRNFILRLLSYRIETGLHDFSAMKPRDEEVDRRRPRHSYRDRSIEVTAVETIKQQDQLFTRITLSSNTEPQVVKGFIRNSTQFKWSLGLNRYTVEKKQYTSQREGWLIHIDIPSDKLSGHQHDGDYPYLHFNIDGKELRLNLSAVTQNSKDSSYYHYADEAKKLLRLKSPLYISSIVTTLREIWEQYGELIRTLYKADHPNLIGFSQVAMDMIHDEVSQRNSKTDAKMNEKKTLFLFNFIEFITQPHILDALGSKGITTTHELVTALETALVNNFREFRKVAWGKDHDQSIIVEIDKPENVSVRSVGHNPNNFSVFEVHLDDMDQQQLSKITMLLTDENGKKYPLTKVKNRSLWTIASAAIRQSNQDNKLKKLRLDIYSMSDPK